jgi:outer membrane protein assembly factor BamB
MATLEDSMRRSLAAVLILALVGALSAQDHWPGFRGAGTPITDVPALPTEWDAKKNVAWTADVAGKGWSSPIVWGDRVFVTSVVADKTLEARKGLYILDLVGKVEPGEHRWLVHCLDLKTGKNLWTQEAKKGEVPGSIHIKNTYASETPVCDGERVYAYFGNIGLFCYDHAGKQLWTKTWDPVKTQMGWGTAASPALHDGTLYILNDNDTKSFLTALDAKTGKEKWTVVREEKSNWTTPFVWVNDQRTEIVTAGYSKVRSYSTDGKLLWELSGMSTPTIPTPFAAGGLLYVTSGYVVDPFLRPMYVIRPGATGDITLKPEETANKSIAWAHRLIGPYHPTPLVVGEHLYILYDTGFLSCFEAKTGKQIYDRKRISASARAFTASPWSYNGKVFCLSEDGDTYAIDAGPEFKVQGPNSLDEMTLATPAIAGGRLLIRTQGKVYCITKAK